MKKTAFTLVEILIVITIIGILAVAVIPRLTGGPARARDAERKGDLSEIATALEAYAADNAGYYPAISGAAVCVDTLSAITPYLTIMPADPTGIGVGSSTRRCSTNYTYYPLRVGGVSSPNGYLLLAKLESESVADDSAYYWTYPGSFSNVADADTNLGTLKTCDMTDCSSGAMVVVGK